MLDGPYAVAIAAGMAATVNPCGFALLPAYLSAFLGSEHRAGGANAVGRALAVSAALTAGFVVVFGTFGLVVTPLALSIEDKLPWVTIVIGIGLVALGVALLAGRQPTLRIPKLQRGGTDGTLPSMFLFGVSYATASLSCTIGPFLAVTTTTFRSSSFVAGFGVFLAYALGMGIVIGVLTVALSLAKAGMVQKFRNALPTINRIAGGLIVVAGAYVAYYGWYELRVYNGDTRDPIVERAIRIQTWLTDHVVPENPATAALLAVVVLTVVGLGAVMITRARTARHTGEDAAVENA
ncbi:MAG: cytochrome c biogenesis protein CcdA [Actinobacteria bacterium]|nr:cytochrome c biogenesis protein CcdA [Actinomycetota bacterium]